jgi:hypothetical protein
MCPMLASLDDLIAKKAQSTSKQAKKQRAKT